MIELRVVSLPATAKSMTKKPNSSSDNFCPSISAFTRSVQMSAPGSAVLRAATPMAYISSSALATALSSSPSEDPTSLLDQSKSCSRSSNGVPIKPAMACNGSSQATCSTKSPCRSCAAALAIPCARALRSSRSRLIARGVNPRLMMCRNLLCRGGSMLSMINRVASIRSRGVVGR
ncbi:Uncharacterised protein [Mycobacteroides abscessus subsp. abscessus]|nr:Uncharacterised protein [Mycobacteroides abscessus subsp. abscessus]